MRPLPQSTYGILYAGGPLARQSGLMTTRQFGKASYPSGSAYGLPLVAKRVSACNIWFPRTVRYTELGFYIPTGGNVVGSHMRFAVYHNKKGTTFPGDLIFASQVFDTDTVGWKTETRNGGFHGGKLYWVSFCADAALTPTRFGLSNLYGGFVGHTSLWTVIQDPDQSGSYAGVAGMYYDIGSFGSFPENPFPASGWDIISGILYDTGWRYQVYDQYPALFMRML